MAHRSLSLIARGVKAKNKCVGGLGVALYFCVVYVTDCIGTKPTLQTTVDKLRGLHVAVTIGGCIAKRTFTKSDLRDLEFFRSVSSRGLTSVGCQLSTWARTSLRMMTRDLGSLGTGCRRSFRVCF